MLFLHSSTALKTCGRQILTYQLAFIVAPGSNGTYLIEPDFMKETDNICFDELSLDTDHFLTSKLPTALLCLDDNDRIMIHHQL